MKSGRGLAKRGLWRAINRRQRSSLPCRREVSRYLAFISLPVSYMVSITLSRQTRGSLVRRSAIRAAFTAFTAAMALRSMHGTGPVRRPGHVRPRLCSMAISAAMHTCAGLAPNSSARPAAAIEHATPTSPRSRLQHQKLTRSSYKENQWHWLPAGNEPVS